MQQPTDYLQAPQQQIPQSNPVEQFYDAPPIAMGDGGKADLLDKIRPNKIVETIRHRLMGEININGKWVQQEHLKDRALSKTGAWDIANLMLSASSQNVAISKLKDYEIKLRALAIARTAQVSMVKNWKEYGIKGTDQLEYLHQIIFTNTFITLKQCENEGIRNLIKGTIAERQSFNDKQEAEANGWKSLFRK